VTVPSVQLYHAAVLALMYLRCCTHAAVSTLLYPRCCTHAAVLTLLYSCCCTRAAVLTLYSRCIHAVSTLAVSTVPSFISPAGVVSSSPATSSTPTASSAFDDLSPRPDGAGDPNVSNGSNDKPGATSLDLDDPGESTALSAPVSTALSVGLSTVVSAARRAIADAFVVAHFPTPSYKQRV
jgi:hypothetical protein